MTAPGLPNPVLAPEHVHALLDRLHTLSEKQESDIDRGIYLTAGTEDFDNTMRDKFIALEREKCRFLYHIARMINAANIVEAGTSFGVSTIYLGLAVGQNSKGVGPGKGKVFATEQEKSKIIKAKEYWREAGEAVEPFIELREGNLLETLKEELPTIDLLLLDIWAPLALPTLKLVQPKLRSGAVVIVDNTISSAKGYQEFLAYARNSENGFRNLVLPYNGGLEVCLYSPATCSPKET